MDRYEVVVVGGGIAGLCAAMYCGWLGRSVLLLDREMYGGQIVNADVIVNVPGFPEGVLGPDLAVKLRKQALGFGAKLAYGEATAVKREQFGVVIETSEGDYQAGAVVLATGGKRRSVGAKGEEEFEGNGISHCATCDGPFFAEKTVAVVGGGDTALDEALVLSNIASKVVVIHRGKALDASARLIERTTLASSLDIVLGTCVEEVAGTDTVERIRIRNLETEDVSELAVSGVFVCAGFEANTDVVKGFVDMDPQGHIRVDLGMESSMPGVFAAGFARERTAGQLASVAGDGVTAAVSAHRFLKTLHQ